MIKSSIFFDPLIPTSIIMLVVALAFILLFFCLVRRLSGWFWRGCAVVFVLMALANPALKTEDRQSESDVVIIIIDRTSSQQLKNRPNQNVKALEHIVSMLQARANTMTVSYTHLTLPTILLV